MMTWPPIAGRWGLGVDHPTSACLSTRWPLLSTVASPLVCSNNRAGAAEVASVRAQLPSSGDVDRSPDHDTRLSGQGTLAPGSSAAIAPFCRPTSNAADASPRSGAVMVARATSY